MDTPTSTHAVPAARLAGPRVRPDGSVRRGGTEVGPCIDGGGHITPAHPTSPLLGGLLHVKWVGQEIVLLLLLVFQAK